MNQAELERKEKALYLNIKKRICDMSYVDDGEMSFVVEYERQVLGVK